MISFHTLKKWNIDSLGTTSIHRRYALAVSAILLPYSVGRMTTFLLLPRTDTDAHMTHCRGLTNGLIRSRVVGSVIAAIAHGSGSFCWYCRRVCDVTNSTIVEPVCAKQRI
jgi:hypothetical protein